MLGLSRQAKMRRLVALAVLLFVLLALYVLGPGLAGARNDHREVIGKVAYATVLTSDEYVLPAQV
jgi:hypothetical protein